MTRLRVLIEVDGSAVVDRDIVVHTVNVDVNNDVQRKPLPAGPYEEWELSGRHVIVIDYRDPLPGDEASAAALVDAALRRKAG